MEKKISVDIIRFNHKYPLLASIGKQVVFWIIAFGLLFFILHQFALSIFGNLGIVYEVRLFPAMGFASSFALIIGSALGLLEHLIKRIYNKNHSLGISTLIGSGVYFVILMGMIYFSRSLTQSYADLQELPPALKVIMSGVNWRHFNYILIGYIFFMTLVISFISQMDRKFGPGYLLPVLLGRFRYPREQERIFMFLDLASSTKLAEQLGHIRYSSLIQDCFIDINKIVRKYHAEIYQYVGDEVVVSWPAEGLRPYASTEFFFAVQDRLLARKQHYLEAYQVVPSFKAGAHIGSVSVVEVGDVKREIAYHGDTLNVAARLESLCSETGQPFLVSAALKDRRNLDRKYRTTSLGKRKLPGRELAVEVFAIARPKHPA